MSVLEVEEIERLRAHVTELQALNTKLETERRMWKHRANAQRDLLIARYIDFPVDSADAHTAKSAELIVALGVRIWNLEGDAWCGAANELREYVIAASDLYERLKAKEVITGSHHASLSTFVLFWQERFTKTLDK